MNLYFGVVIPPGRSRSGIVSQNVYAILASSEADARRSLASELGFEDGARVAVSLAASDFATFDDVSTARSAGR